jgi:hypothetical protein
MLRSAQMYGETFAKGSREAFTAMLEDSRKKKPKDEKVSHLGACIVLLGSLIALCRALFTEGCRGHSASGRSHQHSAIARYVLLFLLSSCAVNISAQFLFPCSCFRRQTVERLRRR